MKSGSSFPEFSKLFLAKMGGSTFNAGTTEAFDLPRGKVVAVICPNGSGKSTLLKSIYVLLRPRGGSVVFRDDNGPTHNVVGLRAYEIAYLGVNFVLQVANVFAEMSVRESLEVGAFVHKGRFEDRRCRPRNVSGTWPALVAASRNALRRSTANAGNRARVDLAMSDHAYTRDMGQNC